MRQPMVAVLATSTWNPKKPQDLRQEFGCFMSPFLGYLESAAEYFIGPLSVAG